jgi:hypothetical protein
MVIPEGDLLPLLPPQLPLPFVLALALLVVIPRDLSFPVYICVCCAVVSVSVVAFASRYSGLRPRVSPGRAAATALSKAGAKPEGRSDKSIAFAFTVVFAFPQSSAK